MIKREFKSNAFEAIQPLPIALLEVGVSIRQCASIDAMSLRVPPHQSEANQNQASPGERIVGGDRESRECSEQILVCRRFARQCLVIG